MTERRFSSLSVRSTVFSVIAGITATAGLASASVAADVALQSSALRPYTGLSMEVGGKRAVGYYVAEAGSCKVTLVVGEANPDVAPATTAGIPARFTATINAGSTARIDTGSGPSLEFTCQSGAQSMTARVVQRVAYKASTRS